MRTLLTVTATLLLSACGGSVDQEVLSKLVPAQQDVIDQINDGMTDGCNLQSGRTWVYPDINSAYIAGALNGPGVEDTIGVWYMTDSNSLVWAESQAKAFSDWGKTLPETSADRSLAWKIQKAASHLMK